MNDDRIETQVEEILRTEPDTEEAIRKIENMLLHDAEKRHTDVPEDHLEEIWPGNGIPFPKSLTKEEKKALSAQQRTYFFDSIANADPAIIRALSALYLEQFEKDTENKNRLQEIAAIKACTVLGDSVTDNIAKAAAISTLYFIPKLDVISVARRICDRNVLSRLKAMQASDGISAEDRAEIINDIRYEQPMHHKPSLEGDYSFATKFCYCNTSASPLFPIYDHYVADMLIAFAHNPENDSLKRIIDTNLSKSNRYHKLCQYEKFLEAMEELITLYDLRKFKSQGNHTEYGESFTITEIDRFLWKFGKRYSSVLNANNESKKK